VLTLAKELDKAYVSLDIAALEKELKQLEAQSTKSDFWSDRLAAEEIMKKQSRLSGRIEPWLKLKKEVHELSELTKLDDKSLEPEITKQLKEQQEEFEKLKAELKFAGPFDEHDVIMSIHAGAGGVDAQDWADMLLRMYLRWAQANGCETKI